MEIDFRPGRVDTGEGAELVKAMRDEIAAV